MSDKRGCVDITRQAPLVGSYDGVSPMGLIWAAERTPSETHAMPVDAVMRARYLDLEAAGPDGSAATASLERFVAGPGVARQEIRDQGIVGTLFLPSGAGPHPASARA